MGMLPSQFKRLMEALRSQFGAIQALLRENNAANHDAQEAAHVQRSEIPAVTASLINSDEDRQLTTADRIQNHREQQALITQQSRAANWPRNAFFAAIFYGFIAAVQAKFMYDTLKQTQHAIDISDFALQQNRRQFADTLSQMVAQTAAQKSDAAAASASVKATQNQMRLDERAWVGVLDDSVSFEHCDTSAPTGICRVQITLRNVGKTPALHLKNHAAFAISSPGLDPKPRPEYIAALEERFRNDKRNRAISPQNTITLEATDSGGYVASHWNKIMSGTDFLYIYGRLEYSDVFQHSHYTVFCFYVADPATRKTATCDEYNDMN